MVAPFLTKAIAWAAPYAGRFAAVMAAKVAALITVQVMQALRAKGYRVPDGAIVVAAQAAAAMAAGGVNVATSAAQAVQDATGVSTRISWDAESSTPIRYTDLTAAAAPAFEPPPGVQSTLLDMAARGQIAQDMVMPTFPPMYDR